MPCVHGFDKASWCIYCKKRKSKKGTKKSTSKESKQKSTSKKDAKNSSSKKGVQSPQKRALDDLCRVCGVRRRLPGARGKCKKCALKAGYRVCVICKKIFLPKHPGDKKCGCTKRGGGSVWIVASAGAPSLGKRR